MSAITHIFRQDAVPEQHRTNFLHLYLDIAWFGILNASTLSFISVYIVRIGATKFQVGLLSAIPAILAIALSVPAGWWLRNRPVDRATFWTSILFRMFYIVWVPLPLLFSEPTQVWFVLGVTFLMSIPGTALAVGFNALFADTVPPQWRGQVAGIRNALLAVTFIVTSLICGVLLDRVPFPLNYQIVFAIGFLGGAMSSYHLHKIRLTGEKPPRVGRTLGDLAMPGLARVIGDAIRPGVGLRFLTRVRSLRPPRFNTLRGPFGGVLLMLFVFHLTQYLAIPLFPIYLVDHLGLSDQELSLGNALFYGSVFVGSTQLAKLVARLGNHKVTALGAVLMASYPFLTSLAQGVGLYLVASVVGGIAWSLAGGALGNYLLDKIPAEDRPGYLAWYVVISNVSILLGSLGGPLFAEWIGLVPALMLIAVGRLMSALVIWRWGK
ncbi:MAG TPA: MFS transporter [Anaerolineales bacterium]|nr:MFS transporter [Anaerolineales bacterium]